MVIGGGLLIQPAPAPVHAGFQFADVTIPNKPLVQRIRGWFMFPQRMGGSWFIPFGLPVLICIAVFWFVHANSGHNLSRGFA